MGIIHSEVYYKHLEYYPEEESILKPFLNGFDITFASRRKAFNTELSVYFFKAEKNIEEAYGISREILVVYAPYNKLEPRTIQAAESFLKEPIAFGRVENLNFFVISDDNNIDDWIKKYVTEYPESRVIIGFSSKDLREAKGDAYYVRRVLNKYLFGRDLFDYRLPLKDDYSFFGRNDIISNLYTAIQKNENKGIFGLRKTGKTSILFKIKRLIESEGGGIVLYYDCKLPNVRKIRWYDLLKKICIDIAKENSIPFDAKFDDINNINVVDVFSEVVEKSKEKCKIIVIFDEIEYISPLSNDDPHWKKDFIDFWQTFWAIQSQHRNICAIIGGVNPYPCEIDRIEGIQNPLFGIVSYQYLRGLLYDDLKVMIKTLGKKMGLKFDSTSIEYIFKRYGGHPLLTRIGCSLINSTLIDKKEEKPITITKEKLLELETLIDSTIFYYAGSVVSELQIFYKDEYEMLELLSSGQELKFLEKVTHPEFSKHLVEYGLLSYDEKRMPFISIPIIKRYIGLEYMKREGRKTIYKVIENDNREIWLNNIKKSIISDFQSLEKTIHMRNLPSLFGPNSFPEADEFQKIPVVNNKETLNSFLNTCYRCFVESIENYGKTLSKNKYFWEEIEKTYPDLWDSLYRIKLYRHAADHLNLTPKYQKDLEYYIKLDYEGRRPEQVPDLHFYLQQCILESLLIDIQIESNKLIS